MYPAKAQHPDKRVGRDVVVVVVQCRAPEQVLVG